MKELSTSPFMVREINKSKELSSSVSTYTDRDLIIRDWILNLSPDDHAKLTANATQVVKNMKMKSRNSVTGRSNMIFSVETAEILLVLIALHKEIKVIGE